MRSNLISILAIIVAYPIALNAEEVSQDEVDLATQAGGNTGVIYSSARECNDDIYDMAVEYKRRVDTGIKKAPKKIRIAYMKGLQSGAAKIAAHMQSENAAIDCASLKRDVTRLLDQTPAQ